MNQNMKTQNVTEHLASNIVDKRSISKSFGSSAATYDKGAALQRSVGNHLLELIPPANTTLMDLGTGPGYFSSALSDRSDTLIGLDIAPKMLEFAAMRNPSLDVNWLCGDAEHLPLASQSIDTIYSSLMLQWVHNLGNALQEAARVLKPGGKLCFSTLLNGTLHELACAWRFVDNEQHINSFLTREQIEQAIGQSGLDVELIECKPHYLYYDNVIGLMRDLKAIGANQTANKQSGLMGRSTLAKLEKGYAPFRTEQGLTTTYQVAYCVLTKSENND